MSEALKIIIPSITTFIVGVLITPFISDFLYKNKMWKKKSVSKTTDGQDATLTQKIHDDNVRMVPRMGGVVIWASVLFVTFSFFVIKKFFGADFSIFSYFSRSETWIPIAVFVVTALFGLIDDYLVCKDEGSYIGGGLSLKTRLFFVFLISIFIGYWMYSKINITEVHGLFSSVIHLGIYIIPLVVIFLIGLYSGGIIDGVDGLAGGVFVSMYGAYALISYMQGQYDISALCMSIIGGILAFLWFNIPPARFFMSETGSMSLSITLGVIAFLTREPVVLLVIAMPLILTSFSSVIQLLSKKLRNGKKIFKVAPLHNHFQAIGWPPYKVTMRYWIFSVFCSLLGVILAVT
jgi:phospho-N-acetylmuramoyl-pentapeptide-transferase